MSAVLVQEVERLGKDLSQKSNYLVRALKQTYATSEDAG